MSSPAGTRPARRRGAAWSDYEPRVWECKDTAAPNPEAERRYVETLRAAFDVPPGLCEWPVHDRPSTTFPLMVRLGARPEVSDEPDRLVSG
jgi:hypothetical protein